MAGNDDRPKKSWAERDKERNRSAHRREERSEQRPTGGQASQAYRSYKTQLNKLFDGAADLPKAMQEQLGDSPMAKEAQAKRAALAAIVDASSPINMGEALDTYEQTYGYPDDETALTRILDSDDPERVLRALEVLCTVAGERGVKASKALKMRVKNVRMTIDDEDAENAADALLRLL